MTWFEWLLMGFGLLLYLGVGVIMIESDLEEVRNPIWKLPMVVFFPITLLMSFLKLFIVDLFIDWVLEVLDYYNCKMTKTLVCKNRHCNTMVLDKKCRLIDTGMRKEITTRYKCNTCGHEWEEITYV